MMPIRDYDPALGQAFQGDVAIVPIPDGIAISRADEIAPIAGRLILQEGETSGHHHAVQIPALGTDRRVRNFRGNTNAVGDPLLATASPALRRAFGGAPRPRGDAAPGSTAPDPGPQARLFRDPAAVREMMRRGLLTRADLAVGCLVVEGGPVVVTHEEHDGIRLPPGRYYIGRQVESAGAEERVVSD